MLTFYVTGWISIFNIFSIFLLKLLNVANLRDVEYEHLQPTHHQLGSK